MSAEVSTADCWRLAFSAATWNSDSGVLAHRSTATLTTRKKTMKKPVLGHGETESQPESLHKDGTTHSTAEEAAEAGEEEDSVNDLSEDKGYDIEKVYAPSNDSPFTACSTIFFNPSSASSDIARLRFSSSFRELYGNFRHR